MPKSSDTFTGTSEDADAQHPEENQHKEQDKSIERRAHSPSGRAVEVVNFGDANQQRKSGRAGTRSEPGSDAVGGSEGGAVGQDQLRQAGQDGHRTIDIQNDVAVSDWSDALGVRPEQLLAAVSAVGSNLGDVCRHLMRLRSANAD